MSRPAPRLRILDHPLVPRVGWRLSLDLLSRGSFVALNFVIARRLGVEEFGRYSYAVSFAQAFQVATEFGTSLFMISEIGKAEEPRRRGLWLSYAGLKGALSLAVILVALGLTPWAWKWPKPWLLGLAMLAMVGNSFYDFLQYVASALGRLDLARAHLLFQRGLLLAAACAVLWLRPTLDGILIVMGIAGLVLTLLSLAGFRRRLRPLSGASSRTAEWGRILARSWSLGVAGVLGNGTIRMGVLMLTWISGPLWAGRYNAAFRVFELCYIAPAAIMVMAVPHLSSLRARGTREELRREIGRLGLVMGGAGVALALVFGLGAPWIIRLAYGESYAPATGVLRVLAACAFTVFPNYLVTNLMVVFDRQKLHARNELVCFLASLPAYWLLSRWRPGTGTAAAFLGSEVLLIALTILSLRGAVRGQAAPDQGGAARGPDRN